MLDTDPIDVLSGSSLNTFMRCPRQWEYAYVYRLRRPPKLRMVVGTAGHAAVELDLRQKIDTFQDLPVDDVVDQFSTTYDAEAQEAEYDGDKELGERKDHGVKSVRFWHKEIAPAIRPMLIEEPVAFTINDQAWTGTLDLVDMDLVLRDWKFTGRTPSSGEAYLLNMVGYALGFRAATGLTESRIEINNIVGLKKTTTHVPIKSDGPVPDRSIEAFSMIVSEAQRSIAAGIFPATGITSGACSWCGYRDICPAYKDNPIRGKDKEIELA